TRAAKSPRAMEDMHAPLNAGDVAWVVLDPALGTEQAGRRPALVLTSQAYHQRARRALVAPITRNPREWTFHVPIPSGLTVDGAEYEPVRVALAKGEQRTPEYLAVNPKGRVPALAEDGWVLTENAAILPYIAQRFTKAGLWPSDPKEAARCAEWIGWIASTI